MLAPVGIRTKQHALRGQSIAPSPPGFLVIAFNRFRQITMHDQPYIRLIYTHTKSYGSSDNVNFIFDEFFLNFFAYLAIKTRMIRQCRIALMAQTVRKFLCVFAGKTIQDTALILVFVQKLQKVLSKAFF